MLYVKVRRRGKIQTTTLHSTSKNPEKFFDEKRIMKNANIKRQSHGCKSYGSTYVEILNSFNPKLQHKNTEFAIKLKDCLNQQGLNM